MPASTQLATLILMPRRKSSSSETPPLVAWEDLPPQREVLDWRKRAAAFGINPASALDDDAAGDEPDTVTARLVAMHEEPEAAAAQSLDGAEEDGFRADELTDERPDDSMRREDA